MSSSRPVVLVVVVVVVFGLMIELLRRRQLREKYAAIWLIVSAMLLFFAIQPTLFARISHFLGFGLPVNLAFASAVVVLLLVSMQLSLESGRREDETQRLAEEIALLQLEIDRLRDRPTAQPPSGVDSGG
ncbi:MAG: DUF2304 domain-containing protein [Actinomycetes bacterium]